MTLEIKNLNVSIGNIPILRDVSLTVPSGQMFGLIGHNGAGKTTLMRAIMGLLEADDGSITFDGKDLRKTADFGRAKGGISYMPEDRRLIPSLTVEENILLPAWANGIADARERLEWVYDLLPEIAQFRARRALQLSGDSKSWSHLAAPLCRAGSCCCLMNRSKVLPRFCHAACPKSFPTLAAAVCAS